MDIKQTIEDLKLRVKNDRRVWALLGLCLIGLLMWSASSDRKNRRSVRSIYQMEGDVGQPNVGGNEAYQDLINFVKQDMDTLKSSAQSTQERLERVERDSKAREDKLTGVIDMVVERIEGLDQAVKRLESAQQQLPEPTGDQGGVQTASAPVEPETIEPYGFNNTALPPPPTPPVQEKRTFISPGDSVGVRLMTGVAAPTDGTPYPVLFKLMGPISGPDGSSLDLGEARIVAAAQGSETDSRVIYRMTDLAFRHPDGRRSVVKVDGWIVGEDGIRGMKGKVIDKLGQVVLATMGYSATASLAESIGNRRRNLNIEDSENITVSGDDLDSAAASALTDGATRLATVMLDKYEKMVPVVEVRAGRDVAAVFAKGAEVSIYDEEEDYGVHTAALD